MAVFELNASLTDACVHALTRALASDQAIALPTDTVYGIGCAPRTAAVNHLLALKGRGRQMPPPVLISSMSELAGLIEPLGEVGQALAERFWPGALTLVARRHPDLEWDLGDLTETIAVRMPGHPLTLRVLEATGALAVTSANLTGQPSATDCPQAQAYFGERLAHYLDAGPTPGPVPSTIVDVTGGRPRILRLGRISAAELTEACGVEVDAT